MARVGNPCIHFIGKRWKPPIADGMDPCNLSIADSMTPHARWGSASVTTCNRGVCKYRGDRKTEAYFCTRSMRTSLSSYILRRFVFFLLYSLKSLPRYPPNFQFPSWRHPAHCSSERLPMLRASGTLWRLRSNSRYAGLKFLL